MADVMNSSARPEGADALSEDKISLVHKQTQKKITDMLNSRMPPGHTKVEVETFLDVLGELEEVQDKDGVNYSSNLINKFLDEKFNFGTTLTVPKCLAVVGHFIYRAKKHSERVNKTAKVVAGATHKWVGTKNYLKSLITFDICRSTTHIYHWKGAPTISSKKALMVIVVALTLLNCLLLIGVINAFSVSELMASRYRTLRSATNEIGDVSRVGVQIAMNRIVDLHNDLAGELGDQFKDSLNGFRADESTILRITSTAACSVVAIAEEQAIGRLWNSLKWIVDGLVMLQYDMEATESQLLGYFDEVTALWANTSAHTNRVDYPISGTGFVMDVQNGTVVRGNFTSLEVAGLNCVQNLQTMYTKRAPPGTEITGVDTHPLTGVPVVTVASVFSRSLGICALAPTSSATAYFADILSKLVHVEGEGGSEDYLRPNLYIRDILNSSTTVLNPSTSIPDIVNLMPTLHFAISVGVTGFPSLFFNDSEIGICLAKTTNLSFTVASTVVASRELPAVVEGASYIPTKTPSDTKVKLAKRTTDTTGGFTVYGETATRDVEAKVPVQLGLQGQSGAILSRGDTYQETSTGYFPIQYLNNNYTVLFERDLADLEAYLWTSFQTDDISIDGTREVRAYTVVDGVVFSSAGEQLAYGEVHSYALECFTRGTSMCRAVADHYTCCMKPHGTNIVLFTSQDPSSQSRRAAEYIGFEVIVAIALVLIALASIRFLTRTVLDHIEKDYNEYKLQVDQEREKFSELVKDVMPPYIASRIIQGEKLIVDHHPQLTFLFSDIVGFTEKSRKLGTTDMVRMLGYMFMMEDGIAEYYNIHKIKTIGDAYFCVSGLEDVNKRGNKGGHRVTGKDTPATPTGQGHPHDTSTLNSSANNDMLDNQTTVLEAGRPEDNQVYRMVAFAATFQLLLGKEYIHFPERTKCFAELTGSSEDKSFNIVSIRMGIHTGPAIAGVVDVGRAPQFDCFGPSVNLASRMESTAMVDRLQLSSPTYEFLRGVDVNNIYEFDDPKKTLVKGYGTITTYHVRSTTLAVPDVLTEKLHIDRATRRQFFTENGTLGEGGMHDLSLSNMSSHRSSDSSKVREKVRDSISSRGGEGSQRGTLRRVLSERRNKKFSSVGSRSDTQSAANERGNEEFGHSPHLGIFGDLPPLPEPM